MVEVECPSCTETVDLGSDSKGIYECPYCHDDFEYEPEISLTSPIIIGKETHHNSEMMNLLSNIFAYLVLTVMSAGVLSLIKFFEDRSTKKKLLEFQNEYSEGILNSDFLCGSGIRVYPNLEAELLPVSDDIPSHRFGNDEITGLVFYHASNEWSVGNVELHIISDNHFPVFVARIVVGRGAKARRKGRDLGEEICALYNLEMDETAAYLRDEK
jgi:hypothetical protein